MGNPPTNPSTAVVTGATKGIGRAVALALARAGYDIAAVARSSDDIAALSPEVEAHGVRLTAYAIDLSEPVAVEHLGQALLATDARLRVLVNNAGAGIGPAALGETSLGDLRRILRLNVVAPYLLTRALAPRLSSENGRVVNIGSAAATYRVPPRTTSAAYAAAKGAISGLTRQSARHLAGAGVTVNIVHPGDVLTEAGRTWFDSLDDEERAAVLARVPRGTLTTAEEVAYAVAALCDPNAGAITGASLDVNGGAWIR